jgi:feruloyl-CoA synthase
VRPIRLGPRDVRLDRREDGTLLLRAPHPLDAYPAALTDRFAHWAQATPTRTWLARRNAAGAWQELSYGAAWPMLLALGESLLALGLDAERPLLILSENDLQHGLLAVAALHAGIPFAAVSPAYALVSRDFAKLRHVVDLLTPGLVFTADATRFEAAIRASVPAKTPLVFTTGALPGYSCRAFDRLLEGACGVDVAAAHSAIGADAPAKFLFTSGSTGLPKAVIQTQRMLTSNQQMLVQALPQLGDTPPVLVDWLPWNHTFGGNHNFGLTIYNGGSLYIDEGRPVSTQIETTLNNLRDISPTTYFNVPRGFELLAPRLRADAALRQSFFRRLGMLFYAGAGLPQPVWDAFDALAQETIGTRVLWVTGLGATETAPAATLTTWDGVRSGMIGLPLAGVEIKLAPVRDKLEFCVRGPSVTPGYWRLPALTSAAFDADGFYHMGDAVRLVDSNAPQQGLLFDGRVAEDFKLTSGTWVNVGPLRAQFLTAAAPYAQDVVITGLDRGYVAALVIPNLDACRELAPGELHRHLHSVLARLARTASGSANRIERATVLEAHLSIDRGELTDKGSVNQAAVLLQHAGAVAAIYAEPPAPHVVTCS